MDEDLHACKNAVSTERVPYPHPPRKKISLIFSGHWTENQSVIAESKGFQVWLDLHMEKEKAIILDRAATLDKLLEAGALPGSRVTVTVLPTETMRAGEIRKA